MANIDFNLEDRTEAWDYLLQQLEDYYSNPESLPVSPELNEGAIKEYVNQFSLKNPRHFQDAILHVIDGLKQFTVHTSHPQYYGLFNPRPNFPGILADTITATFNPQLAAWSHAPYAIEVENRMIREFGEKFGYSERSIDGIFTTGGAEANLTALLCALNWTFSKFADEGLRALDKDPVIYVSAESHHSLIKAARVTGLGIQAVRSIPVNSNLQMRTDKLKEQIEKDLDENRFPLMVVATMGTTGTGAIDKMNSIAKIASAYDLWLHADAAYGGAVVLTQRYKKLVQNIHQADSITFDAHKWMSVPMGAGMFITKHTSVLGKTFHTTPDYMPKESDQLQARDPFTYSIQWSRRFIGLKVYLSLLVFGWEGYREMINRQMALGKLLRTELQESGWIVFNKSELPVICFGKEYFKEDPNVALQLSKKIIDSRKAWVSVYKIHDTNTIRTCITNYATNEQDIRKFLDVLSKM